MGSIIEALTSGLEVLKYLNPFDENFIFAGLFGNVSGIFDGLGNLLGYLNPLDENFIFSGLFGNVSGIFNGLGSLLGYLNPFDENFIFAGLFGHVSGIFDGIGNIVDWLNPFSENFFVYKLIELLGNLFKSLFIPKQESYNQIGNVFSSKLGFVDVIKDGIGQLQQRLNSMNNNDLNSFPSLTITLNSKWYKGSVKIFDCYWFSGYIQEIHMFVSGFAYIFFMWRLFKRLPNIISGFSSISSGGDKD